jgi:hypothetical protein
MLRSICKLTLLFLVFAAALAYADEPDVVAIESGNRMTGTIRGLSRGQLSFSVQGGSRGARTISIDWENVVSLKSGTTFDVELSSGKRFAGSLDTPSKDKLEIKTASGPQTVDKKDVIRIAPIQATFRQRTEGSLSAGLDLLQANSEFDLTLEGEVKNRTKNFLSEASLESLVRRSNGTNTQTRNYFDIGTRRFLHDRWFVIGQFDVQQDKSMDLDLRLLAKGGVGRTLFQSNRTTFAAYGGFDYNAERYGAVPGTARSPEALGAVEWDLFDFAGRTELFTNATTFIALDQSRARFELDTGFEHSFFHNAFWDFNWGAHFFETYDSKPPAGDRNNDSGLALTLGWSF